MPSHTIVNWDTPQGRMKGMILKEIVGNFSDNLELIRELVSNSADAHANNITITFSLNPRNQLILEFKDDGLGMGIIQHGNGNMDSLLAFFELGNSTKIDDPTTIGHKGFGSKISFKSISSQQSPLEPRLSPSPVERLERLAAVRQCS